MNEKVCKILGVDYGSAHTGFAVSDALRITAQGVLTYDSTSMKRTANKAAELAKQYEVCKVVVGLPKNLDNSIGERALITQRFIEMLKTRTNAAVVAWDERFTTVSAIRALNETNIRGKKREAVVDTLSAVLILQSYLDYIRRSG